MTAQEINNEYASSWYKTNMTIHSNVFLPATDDGSVMAARPIPVRVVSTDERTCEDKELDAIRCIVANMVGYGLSKYHGGTIGDVAAISTDYDTRVHIDILPPAGCPYTGLCIEVQTARNPRPIWSSTEPHFRAKVKGTKSKTCAKSTWRIISGGDYMKEVKA